MKKFSLNVMCIAIFSAIFNTHVYADSHKIKKNISKPAQIKAVKISPNETANIVYGTLINELALVKNNPPVAATLYMDYVTKYKNPWFAERATQIAIDNDDMPTAKKFADIWQNLSTKKSYNLYRTLAYIDNQLKNNTHLEEYIKLWISTTPKDKLNAEILSIPEIIPTNNPILATNIANILKNYDSWESQLTQAKLLIKAKQDNGKVIINELKQKYPFNDTILFTWLSTITPKEQIEFLSTYIEKFDEFAKQVPNKDNIDSRPNLKKAQIYLLTIMLSTGNIQQGIEKASIFNALNSEDPDFAFILAQFYRVNKQHEDAYATMLKSLEINNSLSDPMYLFLADISKDLNKFEDAAHWLEKINSDSPKVLQTIAFMYMQAKQFDKAHAIYQNLRTKIDKTKLTNYDTILLTLWVSTNQQQYALEAANRLLEANPKNIEVLELRSNLYFLSNNLDKAEKDLNLLISLAPNNINSLNSLAYLYANTNKNLDIAYNYAQKAVTLEPNNYAYQDTIGWVLYKQGKINEARRWLEQSWNTKPEIETANHLGEVLWKLGERDLAKIIWQKARELNNNAKALQELEINIKKITSQ